MIFRTDIGSMLSRNALMWSNEANPFAALTNLMLYSSTGFIKVGGSEKNKRADAYSVLRDYTSTLCAIPGYLFLRNRLSIGSSRPWKLHSRCPHGSATN